MWVEVHTRERSIRCPDCGATFDVSDDLSWYPKVRRLYQFPDGTKRPISAEYRWCLECEAPTMCEDLPNPNKLRETIKENEQQVQVLNRKFLGLFKSKNANRVKYFSEQIEILEGWLSAFSGRRSKSRCLSCGSTEHVPINLPDFKENHQRKIDFIHPGCRSQSVLEDGTESKFRMSLNAEPDDLEEGRELLFDIEGRSLSKQARTKRNKGTTSRKTMGSTPQRIEGSVRPKTTNSEDLDSDLKQGLERLNALESLANVARANRNETQAARIYGELMETHLASAIAFSEQNPASPDAYHYLGRTYRVLEMWDRAIPELKKAIDLGSSDYLAIAEFVMCCSRDGRSSLAKTYAELGVERRPDIGGAWSNLAAICYELGEIQDARRYAIKANELDPNDPAVKYVYGLIFGQKVQ